MFVAAYSVEMRFANARNSVRPTRRDVYTFGARNCAASPSADPSESIKYDGKDLIVSLCFKKERDAMEFEFDVCKQFSEELQREDIDVTIEPCSWPAEATKLLSRQYVASETDSPQGSVASSVRSETVPPSSDEALFQMIEHPSIARTMSLDKCHLVDSAKCEVVGLCSDTNKSNMVVLSPGIHRAFDGTSCKPPSFYIKPSGITSERVADTKMRLRTRVTVVIVFENMDSYGDCRIAFKDGTVRIDACTYESFVDVLDPQLFVATAEWKMGDTLKQWV